MMISFLRFFSSIVLTFCILVGKAQVVTVTNPTNTTPNLAATYTSLANAITALNTITSISGPVTITLNAGNPQPAPAGGYAIQFAAVTTALTPIIITGNNNTITAFTPQVTGRIYDAIFKIIGADYITIQEFNMIENPANLATGGASPTSVTTGNNMTEWGVALLYASTTDGAQNNTIQNNSVTLNKTYRNTFGIYSNTNHSATVPTTTALITNLTGSNSNNKYYSNTVSNVNMGIAVIGSSVAAYMDTGNDVGGLSLVTGNTVTNWGGQSQASVYINSSGSCYGVFVNNQKDENVSFNTITSAAVSGTAVAMRGVLKEYSAVPTGTFSSTISNNSITITDNFTSGVLDGIRSQGISSALSTATINIVNNLLLNISATAVGANIAFVGISNTSQCGILNITGNTIRGTTTSATAAGFTGISNSGAVITALNINNNNIGDNLGDAVIFSAANNQPLAGITVPTVASTAAVSISGNNFQGFTQNVAGTGAHTYISLVHAASGNTTDNINSNTFTNLTANTSGNVTFISRSGTMAASAGATENCNNNAIITGFSKTAGGTVVLYNATSGSLSGNSMVQTGNNFSNITLAGSIMNGWNVTEGTAGSGPTKTISNNIFSNWSISAGASPMTAIQVNNSGSNTVISGNIISDLSCLGSLRGIVLGTTGTSSVTTVDNNIIENFSTNNAAVLGIAAGSTTTTVMNISNNTISGLSTIGGLSATGVSLASGVTTNVFKNKLYNISATNVSASSVSGLNIGSGISGIFNITNNYIGDLHAPISNSSSIIYGIIISTVSTSSTLNLFYNTIFLNAASSGTDFGTTGIYVTANGTAANGPVSLRNNIIVNTSVPKGSGLTVAYRRSGIQLNNYTTSSNNNIFYAGTASASNLIFFDGTNSDQTIATFKTRVGPTRESNSVTELPPFLGTTGSSPNYLHIDPSAVTRAESRAVNITGITDDFDANVRQGNAGYAGAGTAPDIGADEVNATAAEINGPVITYTALSSPTCTFSPTISNVTITDETGIPLTGSSRPRIYYRKNTGTWYSQPGTNTGGTSTNSTWDFTMVAADMGGVIASDTVSYYIVAEDVVGLPGNISSNPATGLGAYNVNNVPVPPTTVNKIAINYILNGTYTVGVGGDFTSLTAAVKAYNNACSLDGPVIFELIDNSYPSETFPITINNHVDASAIKTLTIRPSATAVPVISGTTNSQTINLSGAKYIIIDGRQAGLGSSRSLTITNTGIAIAINFINGAQNSIVRYSVIKGQRLGSATGTIVFGTDPAGTGNDNNIIEENEITDATGQSSNAVFSLGSSPLISNDNNEVKNNLISNYFDAVNTSSGIYLGDNNNNWVITGNRLFQTSTRVYTVAKFHYGIRINYGTGYTISNNVIGFSNASGTGSTNMIGNSLSLPGFPSLYTPSGTAVSINYIGIACSFGSVGTASTLASNTISGIAMFTGSNLAAISGVWCGIYLESGNANILNNTIGTSSGANNIYVTSSGNGGALIGIRAASIGFANITNNTIGGITVSGTSSVITTAFTGISFGGAGNFNVNNNQVGNATSNNIRQGYFLNGANLSDAGTATATSSVFSVISGIQTTSMSGNSLTINGNILQGWQTSGTVAAISGISASFSTMTGINPTVNINQNALGTASTGFINYAFTNTGFTAILAGITFGLSGSYETNIKENDIRGITYNSASPNDHPEFLMRYLFGTTTAPNGTVYIRKNTFSNISLFSIGSTSVIEQSCQLTSGAKMYVDSNRIVGTFSKTGGGVNASLSLIYSSGSSVSGAAYYCVGNDFSNITVSGAFLINGLVNIDGASVANCPVKIISGNILTNWAGGSLVISMIYGTNYGGTTSAITENTLSNISTQANVDAIRIANASMLEVNNNIIDNISSTGSSKSVYGINSSGFIDQLSISKNLIHTLNSSFAVGIYADAGAAILIDQNKIYNINASASNGFSSGIRVRSLVSSTVTLQNNIIGKITAPTTSYGANGIPVTGIHLFPALVSSNFNIYNNTVYLDASSSVASFSSAALFDQNNISHNLNLRNNILVNVSTPGASGRTASFWRSGTDLTTYQNSSDNNLFYAGVPGGSNVIFFDETSIDQTLAGFKTRVNPRDDQSVSMLPSFISTTGADATFLHLSTNNNCGILGGGDNTGILLPADFDNETRLTTAPFIIDIGADEASKLNFWTGSNGSNWNDAGNWSTGIIPNSGVMNVSISNPPVTQPVIANGDTYEIGNLYINSGATLTNLGTINVSGRIFAPAAGINNFQAAVVKGSINYKGDCISTHAVAGNIFLGNAVNNLTATNHITLSSVSGEELKVAGTLSFGASTGKTIQTNNNLVLLSSALATAGVADITGNSIIGTASVERYVNTGLVADGRHPKSWQFLATPTKGQTIFQSWQENGTAPAGFGTIITGTGTGFDIATTEPSMKFFDPVIGTSGNWSPVTNTGNLIYDQRGYLVFVRGDRSVTTSGGAPNPTILRTKGTLFQPNDPPPVTNVIAGKLASVGNPYASSINVEYMRDNGLFINLNNDVIVWDPLVYGTYGYGGYQTLSAANDYEPTSGGTAYYPAGVSAPVLQSGQAFFVRSSGPAGTVTFTEACKENSSRLVNRSTTARAGKQYLRALLCTNSGVLADGNAVVFHSDYRNGIDADDGVKLINTGENFGIYRDGSPLSVEARKKVNRNDTVFYFISNLRKQSYQLKFAPKNLYNGRLEAFLADRYLHLETAISLTDSSIVNISINNDPASSAADRFYVIFRQRRMAPAGIIAVSAQRREDETAVVRWNVSNEIDILRYEVERSTDGNVFKPIVTKFPSANNGVLVLYDYLDENAGTGELFYRIRMQDTDSNIQYSNVVKLDALQQMPAFSVYPNPVADRNIRIYFSHIPEGRYILQLINAAGQQVYQTTMNLSEGSQIKDWKVDHTVAAGNYHLKIVSPGDRTSVLTVVLR